MSMKAFNLTLPADTTYRSLWTLITAITGFTATNQLVPDRCSQLIIGSDSGIIRVSDANNANVAGMPIANGASINFSSSVNDICLKEIYIMGNGLLVSGWFKWR